MLRYLPRIIAALAAGLLVVAGIAPAHSNQKPAAELEPVMVVMDYSSSMLEADADSKGTSRIDAAKKATGHLIDNAPQGATMGLVVYGSKTPQKCDDITTIQKPGPVDKKALKAKIGKLEAVGETPIGASLLHAADELKGIDGAKSIILVSDGEENCSQPPACEAAKDLAGQGIDLTVHTIGFKVNSKARSELECIAEATGGNYVTADNTDELAEELTIRTLRAFSGYQSAGTPITGAEQMHQAPAMVPGQYLDSLAKGESKTFSSKDGTTKYYKVGPIAPGERAHFAATMIPDQSGPGGMSVNGTAHLKIELVNGQGKNCARGSSDTANSTKLGRPMSAYTHSPEYREDSNSSCFTDGTGELYAKVVREGDLQKDKPMDVELLYVLEPAVDATLLGAEATSVDAPVSVKLAGAAQPVLGGSSFNDALEVDSGKIYADSAMVNEGRYYKIHVGNGQKLNVRSNGGNNTESSVNSVDVRVYSAVRDQVAMEGSKSLSRNSSDQVSTLNMQTAVNQSNRDGSYGEDAYLAGDYYVVVHSETFARETNGVPFEYEIAFEVTGTEQPFAGAAPIFSGEPAAESASAAPDTAASETPPESASAPAEPSPEASPSPEALAVEPAAAGSGPLWPWFTGGLLGTAALLGAGAFLLRHRSTSVVEGPTELNTTKQEERP